MDKYGVVETWTKLFEITLGDTFFFPSPSILSMK